jgi:hypothetical protein
MLRGGGRKPPLTPPLPAELQSVLSTMKSRRRLTAAALPSASRRRWAAFCLLSMTFVICFASTWGAKKYCANITFCIQNTKRAHVA